MPPETRIGRLKSVSPACIKRWKISSSRRSARGEALALHRVWERSVAHIIMYSDDMIRAAGLDEQGQRGADAVGVHEWPQRLEEQIQDARETMKYLTQVMSKIDIEVSPYSEEQSESDSGAAKFKPSRTRPRTTDRFPGDLQSKPALCLAGKCTRRCANTCKTSSTRRRSWLR